MRLVRGLLDPPEGEHPRISVPISVGLIEVRFGHSSPDPRFVVAYWALLIKAQPRSGGAELQNGSVFERHAIDDLAVYKCSVPAYRHEFPGAFPITDFPVMTRDVNVAEGNVVITRPADADHRLIIELPRLNHLLPRGF